MVSNHLKRRFPAVHAKFFWAPGSRTPGACPIKKSPPLRASPVPDTGQLPPLGKHLEQPRISWWSRFKSVFKLKLGYLESSPLESSSLPDPASLSSPSAVSSLGE